MSPNMMMMDMAGNSSYSMLEEPIGEMPKKIRSSDNFVKKDRPRLSRSSSKKNVDKPMKKTRSMEDIQNSSFSSRMLYKATSVQNLMEDGPPSKGSSLRNLFKSSSSASTKDLYEIKKKSSKTRMSSNLKDMLSSDLKTLKKKSSKRNLMEEPQIMKRSSSSSDSLDLKKMSSSSSLKKKPSKRNLIGEPQTMKRSSSSSDSLGLKKRSSSSSLKKKPSKRNLMEDGSGPLTRSSGSSTKLSSNMLNMLATDLKKKQPSSNSLKKKSSSKRNLMEDEPEMKRSSGSSTKLSSNMLNLLASDLHKTPSSTSLKKKSSKRNLMESAGSETKLSSNMRDLLSSDLKTSSKSKSSRSLTRRSSKEDLKASSSHESSSSKSFAKKSNSSDNLVAHKERRRRNKDILSQSDHGCRYSEKNGSRSAAKPLAILHEDHQVHVSRRGSLLGAAECEQVINVLIEDAPMKIKKSSSDDDLTNKGTARRARSKLFKATSERQLLDEKKSKKKSSKKSSESKLESMLRKDKKSLRKMASESDLLSPMKSVSSSLEVKAVSNNELPTPPLKRKVSFDKIHVMEHPIELGDNPCVAEGAPVTIGWKCQAKTSFDVELFEQYRQGSRSKQVERLPTHIRHGMLKRSGYSDNDLDLVTQQVRTIQAGRNLSNATWDNFSYSGIKGKKSVSFGDIELIELPVVIGDNPSVASGGAAIQLGWECQKRMSCDLTMFESFRAPTRKGKVVRLTQQARHALLGRNGFTQEQVEQAAAEIAVAKKERQESLREIAMDAVMNGLLASSVQPHAPALSEWEDEYQETPLNDV